VLVPDSGGAGSLVEQGVSGFRFRANDPVDLAQALEGLTRLPADEFQAVVSGARALLSSRFAPEARANDYRDLIMRILR
jgi:glycosyltransferase involved in cell wall biosynthesis